MPRSPASRRPWRNSRASLREWKTAACRSSSRSRRTSGASNSPSNAANGWRPRSSRCGCSKAKCSSPSGACPPTRRRPRPMLASATEADFAAWMGGIQARVEAALARSLPGPQHAPSRLHQAMRYATLGGGKRVRPLLTFAAGELAGADGSRLEVAASAVELIHAYSLVHDDMPCMDDDVLRRGKPTVHVEYDEATALLAGDSLQSLAFQLLAEHRLAGEPKTQLEMVRGLAAAAGPRRV